MPLIQQSNKKGNSSKTPLYVEQVFNDDTPLYYNGLGLDPRLNQNNYPGIIRIGSVHAEIENNVLDGSTWGESDANRISIGMPISANGVADRFTKPSSSGIFYISSTSANDTSAGTGARTLFLRGLLETSSGIYEEGSESITLNGTTGVATTLTNWFRINLMFVLTAGSTNSNVGDLFISDTNAFTAGVPDNDIIYAALATFGLSTCGDASVGTYQTFVFTKGNIFTRNSGNTSIIRETYTQPFNSTKFQVGYYGSIQQSFDYTGAGSYTAGTDVHLDIFETDTGSPIVYFTYYIEFVLVDNRLINSSPIGFTQT